MSEQLPSGASAPMPVVFVPHGGGPMPLLDDPSHRELIAFLKNLPATLPRPSAIVMISAHWEEDIVSISSAQAPEMIYDYHGFPPESYAFSYPAPGHPALAERIAGLLRDQAIEVRLDCQRGYDHGTFVPLLLMYPAADIPVVQLSLLNSLDPAAHIAIGRAIAPLREEGVLILGSGMSFHNMQAFFSRNPAVKGKSQAFDAWLNDSLVDPALDNSQRQGLLERWQSAPEARFCHPREEHLLPLHLCLGAARATSLAVERNFSGLLFNTFISGFVWR